MSVEGSGRDARIERLVPLLALDGIDAATVQSLLPSPFDGTRAAASAVQQRLWFINQLRTPTAAYHLPLVLRLTGALDVRALSTALTNLAARHEILRTTLVPQGGVAVQQIWPASAIDVPIVPVHAHDDDSIVAAYRAEAARLACEPFDLTLPYPWRFALLRAAPTDHCLVFVFHHANFDGWSIDVLLADLAREYAAALGGRLVDAAALPLQYAEFAAWQRVREAAGALDADIAYWIQQLAGLPAALDLGGDRPAGSEPSYRGGVVHREIEPDLMGRLAADRCRSRRDALHRGPRRVGRVAARAHRPGRHRRRHGHRRTHARRVRAAGRRVRQHGRHPAERRRGRFVRRARPSGAAGDGCGRPASARAAGAAARALAPGTAGGRRPRGRRRSRGGADADRSGRIRPAPGAQARADAGPPDHAAAGGRAWRQDGFVALTGRPLRTMDGGARVQCGSIFPGGG